ncbi:Reverse transcriptase [Phytophthora palmivora]|uniref:Reverse transcriptase n=1 Tax=Phytophthora palmivora TaxID=4796 RepID=A0A2P4Y2F4_9STRA|nr:Reverse transcriptase [Phytophthora palmivora]
MKALEIDDEDPIGSKPRSRSGQGWSDEDLENRFYNKEFREFIERDPVMRILRLKQKAGMTTGAFDADDAFDLNLKVIQTATQDLFSKLKILVDEIPHTTDPVPSPPASLTNRQTSSSHYASAAEDESDLSSEPKRMSLGPSGTLMLEARSKIQLRNQSRSGRSRPISPSEDQITPATTSDASSGTLQKYFEAAMSRFLVEQRGSTMDQGTVKIQDPGSQDVEMESVRSEHSTFRREYNPDNIDFPAVSRATVATATSGSAESTMIQSVRISAISDLTEFTGKDQDEDRARAWIGKVKSAFMRGQASDEKKCLTFADLLTGSAKNCEEERASILREVIGSDQGIIISQDDQLPQITWASPIVVIVKKIVVDIRLCIDYRLINSLTRQMVYPMSLINNLLEDLDKILWYCPLDMASGFWVVTMTDRVRAISTFITPFGLFEWNRMPFGLKNEPQIYQRLIDNSLYGFTRIPPPGSDPRSTDVFEVGKADDPGKPSVIGRRSYIDDILIPADRWDQLYDRVDALLEACDKWNLSISVVKSF